MNSILDDFKIAFRSGNILNQIIIINVVIFVGVGVLGVLLTLVGERSAYFAISNHLMLPSNTDELWRQPWTIITYFFFHKQFFHILWNMLCMYWFGRIISEYIGQNKLLGLYVWGGIGGGVLYLVAYNFLPYFESVVDSSYLLGASAGVICNSGWCGHILPRLYCSLVASRARSSKIHCGSNNYTFIYTKHRFECRGRNSSLRGAHW